MDAITYSLYGDSDTTREYYDKVARFSDDVIEYVESTAGEIVNDYIQFVIQREIEETMEKTVYGFELLMLGVLWRTYIKKALSLSKHHANVLSGLVNCREEHARVKVVVDGIRGILSGWLVRKNKVQSSDIDYNIVNLSKLISWLRASGQFNEETQRMNSWAWFLTEKTGEQVHDTIYKALKLADWFEVKSNEALGDFTQMVEDFVGRNSSKRKWRENSIFLERQRVEYHLNMAGAEIMNRSFRKGFVDAKEKRVLLPICMRYKLSKDCKAVKTNEGYLCMACCHECRVNELTSLGKKNNFKVYIIPHASSAFTRKEVRPGEIGIVGIACTLNLISGGYKAKRLGFEPQCILLNYSGCKKHWHKKGLVTDIDMIELVSKLDK